MEKLVIIDGNSLINRAFYALPPLTASDGTPSQAVYGFVTMLTKLISDVNPRYFAVAFDTKAPTFRHKQCDTYKATRKGMPDELAVQLAPLKKLLGLMGIRCIECEGFEADDIIGTVAKTISLSGLAKCIIVTGDRDSLQLVDENVSVMLTKRGISEVLLIDKDNFEQEIGLKISQIVDYKALSGDSSDNISGVPGIGDKTATNLLVKYDTLDGIYQNIESISGAVRTKLENGRESAYQSKELATICTSVPIDCDLDTFLFKYPFSLEVKNDFTFLGFRSLLKRAELFSDAGGQGKTIEPQIREINTIKIQSMDKLYEVLSSTGDLLSIYIDGNIFFSLSGDTSYEIETTADLLGSGVDASEAIKAFKKILEDPNVKKLVFDSKPFIKRLAKLSIGLKNYEDIKLMQYLADMTIDYSSINTLSISYGFSSGCAAALVSIYDSLVSTLGELSMTALYRDVELPLVEVLSQMEDVGFRVDLEKLGQLGEVFSQKMRYLTEKIYELCDYEFNVNSPKQLADVLFNRLAIPYPKKSKTYSTNAEILQEISGEHPVIDYILEYRTYLKLNNTYVEGLKKLAYNDGIIHTEFKQMVTTTGRLSSVEPNLQNIPVRDEEGKVLREIFISSEGRTLIAADYSQIELRLLAHYSGDEKLISAYKNGQDIHSSIAAEVFNIDINDVTPKMRREAKAVNFGIIYGISDFGLAKTLKIPRYKAKEFIDTYFARFESVKNYLNASVESAKKLGYAETILGRKRKIPELFSPNFNLRSFGERAAMNMPLQGTAADIVKIAMIRVNNALRGKKSRLILQVHDELIIDAHDDELEEVKAMLNDVMSSIVELKVPLSVNIASGKRWSDCK